MNYTYIASSNTATNGVALGVDNQDITVWKILVGLPVDGGAVTVFDKVNPVNAASTNIAFKLTQPTAAAGKDWVREVNFGKKGLQLGEGGNVIIDQTMQVTVLWTPTPAE